MRSFSPNWGFFFQAFSNSCCVHPTREKLFWTVSSCNTLHKHALFMQLMYSTSMIYIKPKQAHHNEPGEKPSHVSHVFPHDLIPISAVSISYSSRMVMRHDISNYDRLYLWLKVLVSVVPPPHLKGRRCCLEGVCARKGMLTILSFKKKMNEAETKKKS